jgi:uncharacterized membrane protein YbhN (UPF0104 family)
MKLGELRHMIADLDWRWASLGLVLSVIVFAWGAIRWCMVLHPVEDVSRWDAVRSIYVGLFANEVLPLRAGEIIRCYLLARWSEIPMSVVLASALIERILDGVWLVLCLLIGLRYVRLPWEFVAGGYFLAILVAACGGLVGAAMFWKEQALDYLERSKAFQWVHVLIKDLHLIGHSRYLYYAALASLPNILIQVFPIYALIRADHHLDKVSFGAAFILMVMLRMGSVIPQAPGNLGTFNAITVLGLHLFGVPFVEARPFSVFLLAASTVPLMIAGLIAVAVTGTKMGEIHHHARQHITKERSLPTEVQASIPSSK